MELNGVIATGTRWERVMRRKTFNVRGTALAVHGAVRNCGERFGSGG